MYKDEVQQYNKDKLSTAFEKDKTPMFIKKYLLEMRSRASARNYYIALKDFFLWLIENNLIAEKSIAEFTPNSFNMIESADITMYLEYKESKSMSPTTLATRKNILSSFFAYLVASPRSEMNINLVTKSKYKGVQCTNNLFAKLPTEKEVEAMMEKIRWKKDGFVRERNLALVATLLGSGIRKAELAGLDMSDLHLKETMPYITIAGKGVYREMEKRQVFITGSAVDALKEWLMIRNEIPELNRTEAVFVTKNGTRMTEDVISKMFKTYGFGISAHQLRHYYSTVMARETGNIVFVAQNMGHKSLGTTVNNYANGAYGMENILANM